jgi:hypothetical protein
MNRRQYVIVSLTTVAAIGFGYAIRAARASGIPATNALSYAGVLSDASGPINGMHNIQVYLYDAATNGNVLCQTASTSMNVVNGQFAVQLPDTCTAAVGSNPNGWIHVLVDGADTGPSKIGAVPYAVEANHTPNADNATNAGHASTADNATNATNATNASHASSAGLLTDQNAGNPHGLTYDWSSGLNLYIDGTQVVTGLTGVSLNVFKKPGNNGSVSCDTFCAGSQWGTVGTCVASNLNGAFIACATNLGISNASVGECWCSEPSL